MARISNRIFVGLPLCTVLSDFAYVGRNRTYIRYCVEHARTAIKAAITLRFVPSILKPFFSFLAGCLTIRIVVLFFVNLRRGKKGTSKFLAPIIEERRRMMQYPDFKKPVDFLQWLMESAQDDEARTDNLCARMLLLNFASIHTTSIVKSR